MHYSIHRIPKLIISGDSDEIDIDVSDDQYDTQEIDVANVPIIVTANKVRCRCLHINSYLVYAFHFTNKQNIFLIIDSI